VSLKEHDANLQRDIVSPEGEIFSGDAEKFFYVTPAARSRCSRTS
jgi:hypothetical protein